MCCHLTVKKRIANELQSIGMDCEAYFSIILFYLAFMNNLPHLLRALGMRVRGGRWGVGAQPGFTEPGAVWWDNRAGLRPVGSRTMRTTWLSIL